MPQQNHSVDHARFWPALAASLYFIYYSQTKSDWHFLDNINLIFHEAGHSIFMFFGDFIHVLGGSLFQVLLPLVFAVYFYLRRDIYSGSFLLFWVGQNIINISVYAADAIAMELPLLGGDSVIHDWNFILNSLGILRYTALTSSMLYWLGFVTILLACVITIHLSIKNIDTNKKAAE